jgi:hypothetical protein
MPADVIRCRTGAKGGNRRGRRRRCWLRSGSGAAILAMSLGSRRDAGDRVVAVNQRCDLTEPN